MRQRQPETQRLATSSTYTPALTPVPSASASALSVSELLPPVAKVVSLERKLAAGRVSVLFLPVVCPAALAHSLAVAKVSGLRQPVPAIAAGSSAHSLAVGWVSEPFPTVAAIDTLERRAWVGESLPENR